ncbi:hypothetical protein BU25DRAFT_412737 [Macroventuria anomochaeta]|uniref:Uncharacterized protein n=1 Tax=Macroventuria anomochaeta TaxID=301207 RepID=A0ACB6RU21_9PLEO|nr:uncharacterized protein BU25DRAFT_412737 [Macroventuria anomochaeta]KAF2625293.1 hypothetical protein BU25DRAFT_412737 [Macroventuria anomochaeta]
MNWFASTKGLEALCSLCGRADAFCVSSHLYESRCGLAAPANCLKSYEIATLYLESTNSSTYDVSIVVGFAIAV